MTASQKDNVKWWVRALLPSLLIMLVGGVVSTISWSIQQDMAHIRQNMELLRQDIKQHVDNENRHINRSIRLWLDGKLAKFSIDEE